MRRKQYLDQRQSDNHERWLVSYADFITLLFAFFVVMYALSSVNDGKYRVLSDSLVSAFGKVPPNPELSPIAMQAPAQLKPQQIAARENASQRRQQEKMRDMAKDIMKVLAPLVKEGKVRVTQSNRGITVEINASVLFAPGQAALSENSSHTLRAVAQVVKDHEHEIQVEGHTDNVPIRTVNFPSNWELSTARASSVVRLFIDSGVDARRLTAVGYGENRPVESNDAPEGRTRNRRVTVMVLAAEPERVTEIPVIPAPEAGR
jgi:chemotaxis protein MotB